MCHKHFMKESVRPWKRVRAQSLVAWCLRWMAAGQCLAATHKWERCCIEGVPPKGSEVCWSLLLLLLHVLEARWRCGS